MNLKSCITNLVIAIVLILLVLYIPDNVGGILESTANWVIVGIFVSFPIYFIGYLLLNGDKIKRNEKKHNATLTETQERNSHKGIIRTKSNPHNTNLE